MIQLFLERLEDPAAVEALQKLISSLAAFPWLSGRWDFLEVTLGVGDNKVSHKLGFKPKDVVLLSVTKGATVSFKYDEFTAQTLTINSTAKTTIRFFYGEYTRTV